MLEKHHNIEQGKDYRNEVPMSVLLANKEYLGHELEAKDAQTSDFVKLCQIIPVKNMSETDITINVVKNALLVEFGEDFLKDDAMVDIITESIMENASMQEHLNLFAERHCQQKELDKSLIN